MNESIITTKGKNILLYRAYTATGSLSSTLNLPITKFKVGIDNGTPEIGDTDLDIPIPITDGTTCDDGSNNFAAIFGGDASTDNTTTYKQGGGNSDVTAQNLIANDTNVLKYWYITDITSAGSAAVGTQYTSMWLYIKDSTALAKIVNIEMRLGQDGSNYYGLTTLVANLVTGWNLITDGTLLNTWTETGTVAGTIDYFQIIITTNNATDEFVAGDVVYDLLRQWEDSDLTKTFVSGFPSVDLTNNEVTTRCYLTSVEANGYDIDVIGLFNEDTTPLMHSIDVFTDESKSNTDEFSFVVKDRIL